MKQTHVGARVQSPGRGIAADHLEALGKGDRLVDVRPTSQVIHNGASVLHVNKRAVRVLEVQYRRPVSRFIGLDLTRGAGTVDQAVECGAGTDIGTSNECVSVATDDAWTENWIYAAVHALAASHSPESLTWKRKHRQHKSGRRQGPEAWCRHHLNSPKYLCTKSVLKKRVSRVKRDCHKQFQTDVGCVDWT